MTIFRILFLACAASLFSLSAHAQSLFERYEGQTIILKGKGFSSGKSYTIRDKVIRCDTSPSGLCYGQRPIAKANYAVGYDAGARGQEQIHLSVKGGKLKAHMRWVTPSGDVEDEAELKIRIKK